MDTEQSQGSLASVASLEFLNRRVEPEPSPSRLKESLDPLGMSGAASLQSALSSTLHSAEDFLAASHGHALALAAEHAEAFRKVQDEAEQLREENRLCRMALAERTTRELPDAEQQSGAHNGSFCLREAGLAGRGLSKVSHLVIQPPPMAPREEPHPPVHLPGALPTCIEEGESMDPMGIGGNDLLPMEDGARLPPETSLPLRHGPLLKVADATKGKSQNGNNDRSSVQASEWSGKERSRKVTATSQLTTETTALRRVDSSTFTYLKNFQVLPDWAKEAKSRLPKNTKATFGSGERGPLYSVADLMRNMTGDKVIEEHGEGKARDMEYELGLVRMGGVKWWILHPLGTVRAILDTISLIMVLYDLIFIPLGFFDLAKDIGTRLMEWLVRLFWTSDMFLSFFKGMVLIDGTLEMRPQLIARRYIRTWFIFDVIVNAFDWMELASEDGSNANITRSMRASRGIRALRLVRLLRLLRLKEVIGMLGERINSHWVQLLFSISKNVVSMVAVAHVIACCWFGIGVGSDGPNTWVRAFEFDTASFNEAYSMSMLWAISQFLGGTDEITAQNVGERVYNIICLLFGFVMGATFIGNLTSSMTQLHILGSQNASELSLLRQFLCQNKVSGVLMLRVQRNAQHALEEELMHMEEERVSLLFRVSEPLRIEIHFEMYSHLLHTHAFFGGYTDTYPQVMRRVCHFAMCMATLSPGDIVFNTGEIPSPPYMYIIVQGEFDYRNCDGRVQRVEKGQCVSEGTLWTNWTHVGTLAAKTPARMCKLDSQEFRNIVTRFEHDETHFNPCAYAADFVKALDNDVSDVWDMAEASQKNLGITAIWTSRHHTSYYGEGSLRVTSKPKKAAWEQEHSEEVG